ncbi:MAG: hypothetical protein RLY47_24, partial [Candidatus Parcubacteria bacterium]
MGLDNKNRDAMVLPRSRPAPLTDFALLATDSPRLANKARKGLQHDADRPADAGSGF